MESQRKIRFLNQQGEDFLTAVRRKVDAYFKETGKPRCATSGDHMKVALMFVGWLTLYVTILNQLFPPAILLVLATALGVLTGILGINISHDAAHGSYSSSPFWSIKFSAIPMI